MYHLLVLRLVSVVKQISVLGTSLQKFVKLNDFGSKFKN